MYEVEIKIGKLLVMGIYVNNFCHAVLTNDENCSPFQINPKRVNIKFFGQ